MHGEDQQHLPHGYAKYDAISLCVFTSPSLQNTTSELSRFFLFPTNLLDKQVRKENTKPHDMSGINSGNALDAGASAYWLPFMSYRHDD